MSASTTRTDLSTATEVGKTIHDQLFMDIYKRLSESIFQSVLSMAKSQEVAEDIVQDVFLKLWKQRERLAEIKDLPAFMFILARNQWLTMLRRNRTQTIFLNDICPQQSFELSAELLIKEDCRLLQRAIQSLSSQQKKIFLLSWEEGWSRSEIAKYLQLSECTVKCTIQNARKSIRSFMMKQNNELERKRVLKKMKDAWTKKELLQVA